MDNATKAYIDKENQRYKQKVEGIFSEGLSRNNQGMGLYDWNNVQELYRNGEYNDADIMDLSNAEQTSLQQQQEQQASTKPAEPKPKGVSYTKETLGVVAGAAGRLGAEALSSVGDLGEAAQYINPFNRIANKLTGGKVSEVTSTVNEGIQGVSKTIKDNLYEPQTIGGEIATGITQFVGGMVALSRSAIPNAFKTAKGSIGASVVTGGALMDPEDPQLANLIATLKPEWRGIVLEGLATDPNDPRWLNRVRAAGGELLTSSAVEGLIRVVKGTHKLFKGDKEAVNKLAENVDAVAAEKEAEKAVAEIPPVREDGRLTPELAVKEAQYKTDVANKTYKETVDRITDAFNSGVITKRSDLPGYIQRGEPRAGYQSLKAVEEATQQIEQWVGKSVQNVGRELPLELRAAGVEAKPAFMRTAEDLITLAEVERLAPKVSPVVLPENVGSGAVLTAEERAAATSKNFVTAEEVNARLAKAKAAHEAEVADLNRTIIKAEKELAVGKPAFTPKQRTKILTQVADRVEALNRAARTSDFPSLMMDGRMNSDGTLNLVTFAQSRGVTDGRVLETLGRIAVGGTKEEITASVAGALTAASTIAGAEDGSQDLSVMDGVMLTLLAALSARTAVKAWGKGTKAFGNVADDAVEAEGKFVQEYAKEAMKLPKNISPITTAVKTLPRVTTTQADEVAKKLAAGDHKGAAQLMEDVGINLDNIDSDQDIQDIISFNAEAFAKQTAHATDGVQTLKETQALAEEIGTSTEDLKALYGQDTAMLAARVTANRALLAASAKRVADLASVATTIALDDRPAALVALRKQVLIHANIQNAMKGVQTEIARALSAFRIKAFGDDLVVNKVDELLEGMGGREVNETYARQIADVFQHNDPAGANRYVRTVASATKLDMLKSYWYSSVLSGISTHVVNIGSGLSKLVEGGFEHAMAVGLGKAMKSKGAEHYKTTDMLKGMTLGTKIVLGLAQREFPEFSVNRVKEAFLQNMPILDAADSMKLDGKVVNPGQYAISSAAQGVRADSAYGKVLDMAGKYVLSVPQRALVAEDEFFKSANYFGVLYMEAAARGRSKGIVGAELDRFISDQLVAPDADLLEQSMRYAREQTFTSRLGETGEKMQELIGRFPPLFLIMPFFRVTTNITKAFAERVPFLDRIPGIGSIADNNKTMWEAGGMQRNLVLAKYATGTMYISSAMWLANSGFLTGGNLFDNKQYAENTANVQPYSLKIGDTYYAYNRFAPQGWFFSFVADWHQYASQMDENERKGVGAAALTIMSKFLESQTFMTGIANITTAIDQANNPNSTGKEFDIYLGKTLASFYPSLFAAGNKAYVDPEVKEFWDAFDPIKARIAGLSGEVNSRRNLFGDPQVYEGGVGLDIASPVYTREANPSPAAKEIYRLNLDLQPPPKRLGNVDFSAKQYDDYMALFQEVKINGKTLKEAMESRVTKSDWVNIPEGDGVYDGRKQKILRNIYTQYRRAVTRTFMKQNPEFGSAVKLDKTNKTRALLGLPTYEIPDTDPYLEQ